MLASFFVASITYNVTLADEPGLTLLAVQNQLRLFTLHHYSRTDISCICSLPLPTLSFVAA